MKLMMKLELKRAFQNKWFVLVSAVGIGLSLMAFFSSNAWGLSKNWMEYAAGSEQGILMVKKLECMDTALQIWMPSGGSSNMYYYIFITIAPLLAAVPYGASYLSDMKGGLINQFTARTKKKYYYTAKLVTAFISGGTVAVIPLIFNLIWCMMFLPWGMPIYTTHMYPVKASMVLCELYYTAPILYIVLYLLFTFVLFGLLNCLCLTSVYLEDNAFAVLLTPFILYFALHVLMNFGFNIGSYSLMRCANLFSFIKAALPAVLLQIGVLIAAAGVYLLRIKKDVI